jgi:hypothetical protein
MGLRSHRDGHAAVAGVVEGDEEHVGLAGERLDGQDDRVD